MKLSNTHYLVDNGDYKFPKNHRQKRIPVSEIKKSKCLLCDIKFEYTGKNGRKYCDEHNNSYARNHYVYGA